jgi:diguanylate cyclase (GGDEF)-like protein
MPRPSAATLQPLAQRKSSAAFWVLMHRIALAAAITHVAFIWLFYSLGATTMALLNVGSVLLFSGSLWCLQRRQNLLASTLIVTEIFLHAVLAVRSLGWDSGFHYYLLVAAPIGMIARTPWRWFKPVFVSTLLLIYLGLDQGMRHTTPLDQVSEVVLNTARSFNIVVTFLMLAYFAHTYLQLVRRAEREMRKLATTDPLTQLLNRRSLLERATEVCTQRDAKPELAFVLADIDHFKAINDHHGHAAGDAVLVAVSEALRLAVREQDSVARWGGEEFLILMPGADLPTAHTVAERLRQEVAAVEVPFGDQLLHVSMTLGVSRLRPGEALEAPVQRADAALYQGKMAGRNQVVDEAATA